MKIKIAGIVNDSIVDGPGFRFSVFCQGCPHACPGCHNPQTHDFDGGTEAETDEIIAKFKSNPLLDGITLTGGEPFCQSEACVALAQAAHASGLNVWSYSGYTFEELISGKPEWKQLLENIDVLVDGRFELDKRTLECKFRGSSNQRLIDVQRSLLAGAVIEVNS